MPYADIVIKSSAIFTAETLETIEGAVVINGKEIEAVCSADEAAPFIGPDTRIIEAGDNMVLPGFNDSHTHFLQNGIMKDADFTLNLEGVSNKEETLSKIAEFAAAHPENEWIVGCGLNYDAWDEKPTRQMLDKIIPDRPVYIASWDMHVGWMSTLALQAAGYTNDTPDPEGGYLEHDENGVLTGLGFEPPSSTRSGAWETSPPTWIAALAGRCKNASHLASPPLALYGPMAAYQKKTTCASSRSSRMPASCRCASRSFPRWSRDSPWQSAVNVS